MIPDITDALLVRSIASQRMIDAGRDYWQRGRVVKLTVDVDRGVVRAAVKGTAGAPYQVELRLGLSSVTATCSCPVGIGCKHAAAALFVMREQETRSSLSSIPHAPTQMVQAGRHIDIMEASLPPQLEQWAAAIRPLTQRASSGTAAATRAILYVVRAQALVGTTRVSKKRPVSSLGLPGCALRLFIEAIDVGLDSDGNPVGAGGKALSVGLYGGQGRPSHMHDEDLLIMRRLQMRIGDTDHEGCLAGVGGTDLFERVLATGRARWTTVRGPSLRQALPAKASFDWTHDDLGRTQLSVQDLSPDTAVVLLTPPFSIDTVAGTAMSLDLGVSPAMAEQLLRLPPIDPTAIGPLAARWHDLVGTSVPAPVAQEVRDLGTIAPTPVLSLCIDKVGLQIRYGGRYGYGSKTKVPCAIARLAFDYNGMIVDATTPEGIQLLRDDTGLVRFTRDADAEWDASSRLCDTGLIPLFDFDEIDPLPRHEWDHAPEMPASPEAFTAFLIYEADALRAEGWRVDVASDFPLRIIAADADDLAVEVVPSGIDWFDVTLGATIDGERVDLVPALRQLLASIDADELDALEQDLTEADDVLPVMLGGGRILTLKAANVLPMLRALLLLATNDVTSAGVTRRPGFSSLDLGLLGEIEAATPDLPWSGIERLRRLARELNTLGLSPTPLPSSFTATLRPYQQTGLDWLEALARAGLGGLLADDMGLGKTVQTLAHILSQKAGGALTGPVLIVAPTSVLPNWQSEIARFAPVMSVLLLHGPDRRDRHDAIAAHDIVLTSYPLLVRDEAILTGETFGLIVFDEAHVLKNPRTAGHGVARGLIADRRIALTGTPVENRLTDAWSLFDLVVPGLLGNQRDFVRDYRNPIEKRSDTAARARLARKLRPFMLRRTKDVVALDLPAKSIVPVAIAIGPAQTALYESQRLLMQQRVRDEIARVGLMRAQIMMLTALTRLRQVCCDPRLLPGQGKKPPASAKLERLLELIDEMIPEGRRIIVFSQFTSMLDLIKPELDSRSYGWVELTGKSKDRKTPVDRFQSGEVPLILVSLKAGGTGLNLTTADTVILYDPWWNPAVEAQAIDRAHRLGQHKPVFVYRMIATGTIEEKILDLQHRKAALAEALWSEDTASPTHITEEDIAFLLA